MTHRIISIFSILLINIIFIACSENKKPNEKYSAKLKELSLEEYPDNPDAEIKHPQYENVKFNKIEFESLSDSVFNIKLIPDNSFDTINLFNLNLMEYLPTASCNTQDPYIHYIGIINQEWNRNQIQFGKEEFTVKGQNKNHIIRVDIARNCLNAYLWEVILFTEINGEEKVYYHGWFDFPKKLYGSLFEKRNKIKFVDYQKPLENWIDPESRVVNLKKLRTVLKEKNVTFKNLNNQPYALIGERKKKYKNIVYPKNTTIIQKFLTDSTLFATFSPPGIYNTKDPRKTKLGNLAKLKSVIYRKTTVPKISKDTLMELQFEFSSIDTDKTTFFYISGVNQTEIPILDTSEVNKGWQNSMGIGNHTFYETYEHARNKSSVQNPYFSILTDKDGKWIDSHTIGIDGPLLHWDKKEPNKLHVWILSFERHAFVGHYILTL